MIKRHGRTSRVIILKSYTVKPVNEEGNHECIYPNPTYEDIRSPVDVDVSPNRTYEDVHRPVDVDVSPNPTYKDVQDDEARDISPNPNFQDTQDNQFSA